MRAAVIGAGPSGFYAADQLLKSGFEVDLFELLPTPFGLVRAGVAPDHPKIKSVTRVYDAIAQRPGFRFFGGVELGADVSRAELLERFEAVVYAVGTAGDNRLGLPGEDLVGSYGAGEFVAWYNGHPDHAHREFDLTAQRAVVIGNGNVAIDVARMLMLAEEELAPTDVADHAMAALSGSRVREVVLVGRRGPAQAAFTNPELLELGELRRAEVRVDPAEMELDPATGAWLASEMAEKTARRNIEILRQYAGRPPQARSHRVALRFMRSPVEVIGDDAGHVAGLRVVHNRIEKSEDGRLRAVCTEEEEVIECGLLVRCIGYRGAPVPGVPFDEARGVIRNEGGRVIDAAGLPQRGEYAVGWIKRGPNGVIGTNKKCAAETVALILEDRAAGRLGRPLRSEREEVDVWLRERLDNLVTWDGWGAIEAHELAAGEQRGRSRVKLVKVSEMHEVAATARRR